MKNIQSILLILVLISCKGTTSDVSQFRTGTFITSLDESDEVSKAIRNDSLQIEVYNNVRDTFAIKWLSNFEYELMKMNPKKGLDSVPFYVKITGVKGKTYTFKANYKGSNFKQEGKATKVND
jgi:hypothetical protein